MSTASTGSTEPTGSGATSLVRSTSIIASKSASKSAPKIVPMTTLANAATAQPKWILIDATEMVVGRLAVTVSNILRGKHKPEFTPHCDTGDFVIVINAEKVQFTGKKWEQKEYQDYSHYAGGQKITPAREMLDKKPTEILRRAVKRMMPRGPLGFKQLSKLKIFKGNQHPHQAQQPKELKLKS